ncbi:MAG: GH92 family glycosyl hydrolase, partial [Bacteroidales bacterium]
MKTTSYLLILIAITVASSCTVSKDKLKQDKLQPVDFVNPYMGNISHLLVPTFPTIHLPHSMMRVVPHRRESREVTVHGLPIILTSHRGTSAFSLSPFQGNENDIQAVIEYSYDHEKITPYSYSVYLDEYSISADLAVSHQSAAYQLEFEKEDPVYLVLNSPDGELTWDGEALSGFQEIGNGTKVYLYLLPETQPEEISVLHQGALHNGNAAKGKDASMVLTYHQPERTIALKYGISFIDASQAKANLIREVAGKTVKELQEEGRHIWNEALGKIDVTGDCPEETAVFYTSLYRCYERPVSISEDGRYYSPFDKSVHSDEGRPFYTDDWIWDTYRAHHPLRTIIDTERQENILHSFIQMSEQMENFWMPTFPKITGDSRSMNCNHGVVNYIDAYRKGLQNFDLEKAFLSGKLAVTEKTLAPWSGMPAGKLDRFYHENGFIPALREGEKETVPEVHLRERRQSVAVTLGTAYDEWCLGQMAEVLNKPEDAERFMKGSFNYRNLYNKETGFFHPKDKNGKFIEPFDYIF